MKIKSGSKVVTLNEAEKLLLEIWTKIEKDGVKHDWIKYQTFNSVGMYFLETCNLDLTVAEVVE